MRSAPPSFDLQAPEFDRRAGLPGVAAGDVARSLLEIAGLDPRDLLLELGAGTGEIGAALAASGVRYAGLDLSLGMLRVFRARRAPGLLVQADAERPWPVRAGAARAVFSSRAAHLMDAGALVEETLRAVHPAGAVFVLGRVRHDPEGLRTALRRRMRHLLAERGLEGRSGESAREALLEAFTARGGELLPPQAAARWQSGESAAAALASWRSKPGLAGLSLAPALKHEVLDHLEDWARNAFADLETTREAAESYELTAVRLPPASTETA
ncbi:MAG TPA: methyltransferase domain-containing protein [Thermoanaerobaculia bacterium]|nr:methyltransferase domain-containing protein [Thermoanaerobaculia bacterium]